MATLKEEAMAYEPKHTGNVADLDFFSINIEMKDGEGTKKDGTKFNYKYIEVEGKEYRIPYKVIGSIKALLQKMPTLQNVSVLKQGEGMNTEYNVIPYIETPTEQVE